MPLTRSKKLQRRIWFCFPDGIAVRTVSKFWKMVGLLVQCFFFPECVARVPVSFGGLGVRLCSRKVVSMSATVRNRSQPFACPP